MTRHFSIPTALRMTPNGLLRELFAKLGLANLGIAWHELPQREVHPILEALDRLPADAQATLETALHNIFDLACQNGVHAILEAADDATRRQSVLYLPDSGGPYCTAAWTWLNYPDVFDRAALLCQVDSLSRWRKRKDLPRVVPGTTPEVILRLEHALSELLRSEQGRGHRCTVEHAYRQDGSDYFLAYPDDFVGTITMHDDNGKLTPRPIRPTFEIVFAYDREEGTLETHARVPTRLKPLLEEAFCRIALGAEPEPVQRQVIYNLNVLKKVLFQLPTDPEDRVAAKVCRVRLAIPDSQWNITLEAARNGARDEMAEMIGECLHEENIPLERVNVTSTRFRMDFHAINGRRPGSLTFDVSEHTRKLALLYAISKNHVEARIDAPAVEWAARLVTHQTRRMLYMASLHVSDSDFDHRCQRLLQVLIEWESRHDDPWMPYREITRRLRWCPREHDEVRQALIDQERIEVDTQQTGGRPRLVYRATVRKERDGSE